MKEIKKEIQNFLGEYNENYDNDLKVILKLNEKKLRNNNDVKKLYTAYSLKEKDISIKALLVIIINEESVGNSTFIIAKKIIKECK